MENSIKCDKNEVYVVFKNERSTPIAEIFFDKDIARKFIDDGDGNYMDIIETHKVK